MWPVEVRLEALRYELRYFVRCAPDRAQRHLTQRRSARTSPMTTQSLIKMGGENNS